MIITWKCDTSFRWRNFFEAKVFWKASWCQLVQSLPALALPIIQKSLKAIETKHRPTNVEKLFFQTFLLTTLLCSQGLLFWQTFWAWNDAQGGEQGALHPLKSNLSKFFFNFIRLWEFFAWKFTKLWDKKKFNYFANFKKSQNNFLPWSR